MTREDLQVAPLAAAGAMLGVWEQFLKPNPGVMAWGGLVAGISAYDLWALKSGQETMSHAFHRAYEHPILKFMCIGSIGAVALHLAHGIRHEAP